MVKRPVSLDKDLKILSRIKYEQLHSNWNIPLLPEGYISDKLLLYIQLGGEEDDYNLYKSGIYEIPIETVPCKLEYKDMIIIVIQNKQALSLFLESPLKGFDASEDNNSIFLKVIYKFKYYNNRQKLQNCYLESNISTVKLI